MTSEPKSLPKDEEQLAGAGVSRRHLLTGAMGAAAASAGVGMRTASAQTPIPGEELGTRALRVACRCRWSVPGDPDLLRIG